MVNVSVLTMGQARGTRHRRPAAARIRSRRADARYRQRCGPPIEILNKPDRLDDAEFAIMKRHVLDGAEILRQTPDVPTLAPVVAFEHHLRIDGSGYPTGVTRASLNVGNDVVQYRGRLRCDALAAGTTSRRSQPNASSRCSNAMTAGISTSTSSGGSCS
jgi:hypothetical protein